MIVAYETFDHQIGKPDYDSLLFESFSKKNCSQEEHCLMDRRPSSGKYAPNGTPCQDRCYLIRLI
jgi:hypothetical protein